MSLTVDLRDPPAYILAVRIESFVMTMACDMIAATVDIEHVQKKLQRIAKDMDLNITFQNETIFKMMHRV